MLEETKYVVMSPCYEVLRYGHDLIKRQTDDAHAVGKLSKFVFGSDDLIDPSKPPTSDNYKFEARQATDADIVIFASPERAAPVDDSVSWGRRKKRVTSFSKKNEY